MYVVFVPICLFTIHILWETAAAAVILCTDGAHFQCTICIPGNSCICVFVNGLRLCCGWFKKRRSFVVMEMSIQVARTFVNKSSSMGS